MISHTTSRVALEQDCSLTVRVRNAICLQRVVYESAEDLKQRNSFN